MGWMNDSLEYMKREPIHRQYHHDDLSFGLVYAFDENFILPLSHDEVVHGKGSILTRMPGDTWQQFANYAHTTASCGLTQARSYYLWVVNLHKVMSGILTKP